MTQGELLNICFESFPLKVNQWCNDLGITKNELRHSFVKGDYRIGLDCEIYTVEKKVTSTRVLKIKGQRCFDIDSDKIASILKSALALDEKVNSHSLDLKDGNWYQFKYCNTEFTGQYGKSMGRFYYIHGFISVDVCSEIKGV